ncbi:aldehyde dehydrogenase domain-containing protein [Trichophaea hybrida]|nr:aldehyde dehydrogenase domain-containing protein [Trichophaea hybrida]
MQPDPSYTVPLLIDSKPITGPKTFPVHNPRTGEHIWNSTAASQADVSAAVASAAAAFPAWKKTTIPARRDLILKAAQLLEESGPEICDVMKLETAAEDSWCKLNLAKSVAMLKGVAGYITTIEGRLPPNDDPNVTSMILREPYGVVLAIAPWNAPIILCFRSVLYPLATGNTVVLKSSELSPRTHFLVTQIFHRAGFPAGTVNLIGHTREDAPEIATALISSPEVRKVNFTGSTAVGRKIAECAGRNLKPVMLELGGKAPVIVCEDADIEKAAKGAAFGAFHHAGQICMSSEKILVHKSISAPFTTALQAAAKAMYGSSQILIQAVGTKRVSELLSSAAAAGATLHPQPEKYQNPNEHHNVIVTNVTTSMDLWHTESFGPVVMVVEYEDEKEAIKMANDTEYGLSAGIWTTDLARGIRIAKEIESGAVHINGVTVYDEVAVPHGGVKNSGFGRFNAIWGLEEF